MRIGCLASTMGAKKMWVWGGERVFGWAEAKWQG